MCEDTRITNTNSAEILGISALTDSLVITNGRLIPYISSNDKEPSWDGHIYIYNTTSASKKDLFGRVPVQVKTHSRNFKKAQIGSVYQTELVSVADMRNYLNDGGVMYFVIYIDETNPLNREIYCATLTPVKLKQYLESKEDNEGKKSVRVRKFPAEANKKIDLFVNFYNHAKEQHSFAPDAVLNYEEIKDSKDVIGISTSVFFSKKPQSEAEVIHQFLNMDDVYFYATVKGSKAPQPIDFCGEIEKIISTKKQTVTIGGIAYYDAVAVEHFKEGISLVFGESLRYTIYHNGKNPECLVSLSPMLRQRYIDLQFILKVIEVGCFYIDGITMTIVPEKPIDEITAELNSMLSYVEKIIRIFEKLNIVDDLNLDNMSNDDHKKINWLLKYYKETDTDKFDSNNSIEKWKIQNLKLMLFIHQDNEQKTIHNKLSSNHIVRYTTDDEEYLMPIYAILSIDDYATLSNINYDDLVLAYTQRVDRRLYDIKRVNTEALKLISAYDISNNNHQLSSAKAIFEYIYGFADSFLKLVIRINILQIIKRERDFTNEEIQELLIIADGSDANDVKACIYLLLDNKPQAEFYYNRLNEEAKNSFLQFPICKFM